MSLKASEFILNEDGSIYHLNLQPEHLADTVITVGDPDRVDQVTKHFDDIEFSVKKREFHTQTGTYRGKRITVISTGIGTDNIDIVFNELDALVNIDFEKKQVKKELKSLDIVRIGTTGSIQAEIPIDSFLLSEKAVGFDGLLHFYQADQFLDQDFSEDFVKHMDWNAKKATPYVVENSKTLQEKLDSETIYKGVTATNIGFYGPQGRSLRLALQDEKMNDKLARFKFQDQKITNLEMETSGIYGMSKLLGHNAVSMNVILANRATGEFTKSPKETMEKLIIYCLDKLAN
ncbi:nucleoside phosphorylase [Zunongwangia sp. HGR-M22]|uniref:nucleoside phosphorylase n=1 Tax=Zunongwangia sp. HGR-M22 TaxID=3015168 RepID=UPI0022DD072D|nr:nucleoside phosphorylase [Zunongwangia sp. HGR-M22]WBL27342.1 nucleoside phosphorylase [Zunongwangia sp. HGR-M22]